RAKSFDKIEAEAIEAKLLDQHPSVLKHRSVDGGIAVAQMWKPSVVFFAWHHHLLIPARMEAVPVTRKPSTLRPELCPPLLPVQRVHLFFIRAGVMVDH